jgi:flagellar biosynthesis/type III secretory pathway chaperone
MLTETQQLAELIESKHQCLQQLRDLGLRQSALIEAENMTELMRMFAGKQRLIEQLHALERRLDPFRDQDPQARIWRSPADRQRCAELLERSQKLLDEIVEQEKRNETNLKQRRDQVAAKLQDLQTTSAARRAYDAAALRPAVLDLSS